MKRAKYFSDDDWSIGRALERAEKVLAEYESGAQCRIDIRIDIIFKSFFKSEQNSRIGAKSISAS